MLMTTLTLVAPPGDVRPTAPEVVDMLWLHAAGGEVAHIHARRAPTGFDVVVFTVTPGQEVSDRVAQTMCARAVRSVPAMQGWQVA
jgi:hypothetical protein